MDAGGAPGRRRRNFSRGGSSIVSNPIQVSFAVKISLSFRSVNLVRTPFARVLLVLGMAAAPLAQAEIYRLPPPGEDVIGGLRVVPAGEDETLIDVAIRYDFGYDEIRAANPSVDAWMLRPDTLVTLPGFYVLPNAPREGIVINTAEMRLYYYPKPKPGQPATVETFPVSIGRGDWKTPIVTTRISGKVENPSWTPPKSIRAEHAADGDPLPAYVPPGPNNPLGKYALRMTLPSYLIHGTNKQYGIGMQVTHGCMRLYPKDIERLYNIVPVGTPVRIINQTYKAGWYRGQLYMEAHPTLDGTPADKLRDKTPMIQALTAATRSAPDYPIDWEQVHVLDAERSGLPMPVGPAPAAMMTHADGAPDLAGPDAVATPAVDTSGLDSSHADASGVDTQGIDAPAVVAPESASDAEQAGLETLGVAVP